MLPGSNRVLQLREPRGDVGGGGQLKRVQCGEPLSSTRIRGVLQLGGELQQPGQAVRTLESPAAWGIEILHFFRDIGRREALRQCAAGVGGKRRVGKHADKPHE